MPMMQVRRFDQPAPTPAAAFGLGPIPYSAPRTFNNDDMTITPKDLQRMTRGRINAPNAAPAIQTPDEDSTHVGVIGRPQVKPTRINYDLPPHPDTTTAQRLGRMLMMQQSY